MGGLFGSPSTPAPAPVAEPDNSAEEEERQRRIDELDRRRRGRRGMITTSPRGLFDVKDWVPQRKSLLGE